MRGFFGAATGMIGLGLVFLYPFMIAGWCLGGVFFGGGSFGTPSAVGIYVGMAAAPIFGGFVGFVATSYFSRPKRFGLSSSERGR